MIGTRKSTTDPLPTVLSWREEKARENTHLAIKNTFCAPSRGSSFPAVLRRVLDHLKDPFSHSVEPYIPHLHLRTARVRCGTKESTQRMHNEASNPTKPTCSRNGYGTRASTQFTHSAVDSPWKVHVLTKERKKREQNKEVSIFVVKI